MKISRALAENKGVAVLRAAGLFVVLGFPMLVLSSKDTRESLPYCLPLDILHGAPHAVKKALTSAIHPHQCKARRAMTTKGTGNLLD